MNRLAAQHEIFEEYCILWEPVNEAVLSFEVVKLAGEEISPNPGQLYEVWIDNMNDGTHDIEKADIFLHGSVKWDGCSNWHFDDQDRSMLHFCGAKDATSLGRLMQRMYEIASVTIPMFDAQLARMGDLVEGTTQKRLGR